MLRKTTLLAALCLLATNVVNAQNAAKYWLFGRYAKINFNTSGPTATTVNTINTIEGCSAISDSSGNLLFYTDGMKVWDKNDVQMPNGAGLNGNSSSTQSALIVPCDCDKYFVFTTDAAENQYTKGLQYSVVNTVAGINYGVTSKNNPLLPNSLDKALASEKIAGVSDGSGGFWVVGHSMGDDRFVAYHVRPNNNCTLGAPVISHVGVTYTGGSGGNGQGQMKFSPDGKRLAVADLSYGPPSYLELFDFNLNTGIVSNPGGTVARDTSPDGFYGVEFAPDSNQLYATTIVSANYIYRYGNLSANKLGSRTITASLGNNQYAVAAMQLAPDGSIYIARRNIPSLYVLPSPLAANGGWTGTSYNLAAGSVSQLGLPAVVAGTFSCGPTPTPTATPKATATATATPKATATATATPKATATATATPTATPSSECCDKITAVPFPQNNLQLDYRTFTITNLHAPVSPICYVDISLNPVPNPIWQGGDLYVDGSYQAPGTKFGSPYTRLPNRPLSTSTISAVNTVKFNLGVDYTIGWSGTATFVVHHCDGSTCTLTYGPWVASPPPSVPGGQVFDTAVVQEGKLFRFELRLKARDWKTPARWISFRLGDGKGQIFAASNGASTEGRDRLPVEATIGEGGLGKGSVLYSFAPPLKGGPYGPFSLVVTPGGREPAAPPIIWTVYDADGNAFETGTVPGPAK